jgi:hypothetical protein
MPKFYILAGMCCSFNKDRADNLFKESLYTKILSKLQNFAKENAFEDSHTPTWYTVQKEPRFSFLNT